MERPAIKGAEMNSRSEMVERPSLHVWDSGDYGPKEAFARLREEVCGNGMVWLPSLRSKEDTLQARFEVRQLEKGHVSRVRCPFLDLERTHSEVVRSSLEWFSGGIILSGSMIIIQNDDLRVLNSGDLLVYDSSYPIKVSSGAALLATGFVLQKGLSPVIDKNKVFFRNLVIERSKISAPLRNCFYFLSDRLMSNTEELNAILEAILDLLPIDAGCFHSEDVALRGNVNPMYREILLFSDQHLQNPNLSANSIAQAFGISERHVYRLFAKHGLRYGAHIRTRRLQAAAAELISGGRSQVTEIAYKWGFNDLSTFSKAFKKKFGCAPHQFRDRF
jgi:AraC family transcriptional regulator, positive regulator of tynA and feaB